jgi:hypothetical protein
VTGDCPQTKIVKDKIAEYGATKCQTVKGIIRVNAHDVDNLDYMSAAMLDALEAALNKYELWQDWTLTLPDLAFLCYVGDSYEEVYFYENSFNVTRNNTVDLNGTVTVNATNSTWNNTGPVGGSRGIFGDNTAGALVLLLGVGLPVTALLVMFAFLVQKRRRAMMTARDFGMLTSEFILVGTGDPPGSFHEGLYHYMPEGTRYLSTNCEGCLETRRNSFFTDHNLGPIPEDREYEEDILISPNSKDLGRKACTMDVHRCSSGTCTRCNGFGESKRIIFLPSMKMHQKEEIRQNEEIYTIPEHVEV